MTRAGIALCVILSGCGHGRHTGSRGLLGAAGVSLGLGVAASVAMSARSSSCGGDDVCVDGSALPVLGGAALGLLFAAGAAIAYSAEDGPTRDEARADAIERDLERREKRATAAAEIGECGRALNDAAVIRQRDVFRFEDGVAGDAGVRACLKIAGIAAPAPLLADRAELIRIQAERDQTDSAQPR